MAEFMRKIHSITQLSRIRCVYACEGRAVTSCQWDKHRTLLWENSVVFMSLARTQMPANTLITLGLSSGAPDSCGFPHHSHMAPSTPFYYLICSLSSPPLTLFCQASESWDDTRLKSLGPRCRHRPRIGQQLPSITGPHPSLYTSTTH